MNLLGKAIKFTEQGEIVVVEQVERTDQCTTLHFSVRDTGIGIASGPWFATRTASSGARSSLGAVDAIRATAVLAVLLVVGRGH